MRKGTLHREWFLWNQMNHNVQSENNASDNATDATISNVERYCDDEKKISANDKEEVIIFNSKKVSPRKQMFIALSLLFFSLIFSGSVFLRLFSNSSCSSTIHEYSRPAMSMFRNAADYFDSNLISTTSEGETHEVIEIPYMPKLSHGSLVYSQKLLNFTFGNSWGHPATVDYIPPPSNYTFNKVVLTLDTWIDGVQYDRLGHIYLDNTEIWRSSTIEPANKTSHSFSEKDLSVYLKLFKSEHSLMFQLDNLLTPRLTGSFNVSLNAYYYNFNSTNFSLIPNNTNIYPPKSNELVPGALNSLFSARTASNNIIPLIHSKNIERPPLVYLPDNGFSSVVPQLHKNTTKVKLFLTTSGNAEEEFWYSNLLDEFKDNFKNSGHVFNGHGPCRVVNVYVDGIRVASANPFPVIFTGGISPALWNPIVSTGSFDIRPLEIDLTPILPIFWDAFSFIEIEITNCIDDDDKTVIKSGIGQNWITSASLLTWEDSKIDTSFGEILTTDNSTKIKSFGISPPFSGFLNQIVKAEYTNKIQSNLTYVLNNGTYVNFIEEVYNDVNQTSLIILSKFGSDQTFVSVPKSKNSFALIDPASNETIRQLNITRKSPLAVELAIDPVVGSETNYQVNITKSSKLKVYLDDFKYIDLKAKENGTSNFTLSPTGNHGFGNIEHNYTLTENSTSYNRHALATNGSIIFDNETISKIEDSKLAKLNYNLFNDVNDEVEEFFEVYDDILTDEEKFDLIEAIGKDNLFNLISTINKFEDRFEIYLDDYAKDKPCHKSSN